MKTQIHTDEFLERAWRQRGSKETSQWFKEYELESYKLASKALEKIAHNEPVRFGWQPCLDANSYVRYFLDLQNVIDILAQEWREFGNLLSLKDLSDIDTSTVCDISRLFAGARDMPNEFFTGIEHWDVRRVVYANNTFEGCEHFNQPIGRWKLPCVHFMGGFLKNCRSFNQPLLWDARNIENMSEFLCGCESFNSKLFRWGGPKGTHYFDGFFRGCRSFNQPLRHWSMKNARRIDEMFAGCTNFAQDISCWQMPKLYNAKDAFAGCCNDAKLPYYETHSYANYFLDEELFEEEIIQPQPVLKLFPVSHGELISSLQALAQRFLEGESIDLSIINTSDVGSFSDLFKEAKLCDMPNEFFAGIERWDVSSVMFFDGCFADCKYFNQPVGCWDVSASCDFRNMFENCFCFDQPLDKWEINGTIFSTCKIARMFKNCRSFNQPLGSWDVSDCEDFTQLFHGCESFNQPLGRWDMKRARYLEQMFEGCSALEQDFSGWEFRDDIGFTSANVYAPECAKDMFKDTLVAPTMQPKMLIERGLLPNLAAKKRPASGVSYKAVYAPKSTAELKNLIDELSEEYHKNKRFLRIKSLADIDVSAVCSMRQLFENRYTGWFLPNEFYAGVQHWDVSSCRDFSHMFKDCLHFNQPIGCWDVSSAKTMYGMFWCCERFNQPLDNWDVSSCENFGDMFGGCRKFNQPIERWNMSNARTISRMFEICESFNQPLGSWDVSNCVDFSQAFSRCFSFNQPLSSWDVSSGQEFESMFWQCKRFDQPLSGWRLKAPKSLQQMFAGCKRFNQPLDGWDVSSCEDFSYMFAVCERFNQPLGSWDMRSAQDISFMLSGCLEFKQDISSWQLAKNCDISSALEDTKLNIAAMCAPLADYYSRKKNGIFIQPKNLKELKVSLKTLASDYRKLGQHKCIKSLADIDVSSLSSLNNAFGYIWDKNIANGFFDGVQHWDVSGCADFSHMFEDFTNFAQDLSSWEICNIQGVKNMFKNTAMKDEFMPQALKGCDLNASGGILVMPFVQQALSDMAARYKAKSQKRANKPKDK